MFQKKEDSLLLFDFQGPGCFALCDFFLFFILFFFSLDWAMSLGGPLVALKTREAWGLGHDDDDDYRAAILRVARFVFHSSRFRCASRRRRRRCGLARSHAPLLRVAATHARNPRASRSDSLAHRRPALAPALRHRVGESASTRLVASRLATRAHRPDRRQLALERAAAQLRWRIALLQRLHHAVAAHGLRRAR